MNKENKTLPQAIKSIVGIYGKEVVCDVRMANIINDVVSLADSAAVKNILRDVIKQGYGGKILAINSAKEDYRLKLKAFAKEICDSLGYKETIVQYILFSIAYGIGLFSQEPYQKNQESSQRENNVGQVRVKRLGNEDVKGRNVSYKKIAAIVSVFVIAAFSGLYYWNSSEDREQFEKSMFTGNSFMSSGDYDNAVESYKTAYTNSKSHKEEAIKKIDDMVGDLTKEGETNNTSLRQAYQVVESALQMDLNQVDKEHLTTKKEELEKTITERTDNGRNTLITIISANKGKLDENGKQLLEDLLQLSPDDYWLNFVKKKSYE